VILIMTSNAGAADLAKQAYGFTRTRREGDDTEAINKLFTPEFRNRLDAVISFGALPRETIYRVVDKFVMQLEAQLADRNVTIELSDPARDWLVERGYDPKLDFEFPEGPVKPRKEIGPKPKKPRRKRASPAKSSRPKSGGSGGKPGPDGGNKGGDGPGGVRTVPKVPLVRA
jgi:ATP-dependent Clp protease ATP-binding subunit ClpA